MRIVLERLVWGAFLIGIVPSLTAQEARLIVLADSISIGQPFEIAVVVSRPAGTQVIFPEPPRGDARISEPLQAGEAELIGLRRYPPADRRRARIDSATYAAVAFAIDVAQVGPLPLRVLVNGDTISVSTGAVSVPVRTALPEDPEGIIGPAPLADFPRALWPWLLALFGIMMAAVAIIFLLRRRRPHARSSPHRRTSAEEAVRRLQALREPDHDDWPAVQAFYVELADILRTYVAGAYGVAAAEMTTTELRAYLERPDSPIGQEAADRLVRILRAADLVKYARWHPPAKIQGEVLTEAHGVVAALEAARSSTGPSESSIDHA